MSLEPSVESHAPSAGEGWSLTCAEQQQHLHAQVLLVGHLQTYKLTADLQHLLTLVVHEGQLHPLPGRHRRSKVSKRSQDRFETPVRGSKNWLKSGKRIKGQVRAWLLFDFKLKSDFSVLKYHCASLV